MDRENPPQPVIETTTAGPVVGALQSELESSGPVTAAQDAAPQTSEAVPATEAFQDNFEVDSKSKAQFGDLPYTPGKRRPPSNDPEVHAMRKKECFKAAAERKRDRAREDYENYKKDVLASVVVEREKRRCLSCTRNQPMAKFSGVLERSCNDCKQKVVRWYQKKKARQVSEGMTLFFCLCDRSSDALLLSGSGGGGGGGGRHGCGAGPGSGAGSGPCAGGRHRRRTHPGARADGAARAARGAPPQAQGSACQGVALP